MPVYRRALSYFWPERGMITALIAVIFAIVSMSVLLAWPMALLIDIILTQTPKQNWFHHTLNTLFPESKVGQIAALAGMYIVLKVAVDTLAVFRSMLNNRIKYGGTHRLRRVMYRHLQDLGAPYQKTRPQGDTLFRLNHDTYGPFGIFDTFFTTAQSAISLAMITMMMASRNTHLTIFAWSLAPLLLLANWHFGRVIKVRSLEQKQVDANFLTTSQRAMSTLGLIQAFGRQKHEAGRFDGSLDNSMRASMRLHWQENFYPLAVQTIFALGQAAVLGYGGYLVYRDQFVLQISDGVTYGDLVLFMGYFAQLLNPLSEVAGAQARIQGSVAASERVFTVLDTPIEVTEAPGAVELETKPRVLTLNDVCFAYPDGKQVLKGLSTRIEPGEMVAFVGPSGTGKSTLLNLLPRFYDPSSGSVSLDHHDLRTLTLGCVRRHMAVVSQDNGLIAGTIAENIRYGNPDATDPQVRQVARMAGAEEFIEAMPEGFDSEIVEGAQNMSGGQRQRIAIARALLAEAPILILDEPTSALDPQQERQFMRTLSHLKGQRTIILVTHRTETLGACDRIVMLGGGRIIEQGSPEELMAWNGAYAAHARGEVSAEKRADDSGAVYGSKAILMSETRKPGTRIVEDL